MSLIPDFLRHKIEPPPKHIEALLAEAPIIQERPPRRYLTEDNLEWFMVLGKAVQVRIRLWRGADACPIALVSHIEGQESPRAGITQIANYILESYLCFSDTGVLVFDDSNIMHKRFLTQYSFEYFGHQSRLRLYNPQQDPKEWDYLCWVLQDDKLER